MAVKNVVCAHEMVVGVSEAERRRAIENEQYKEPWKMQQRAYKEPYFTPGKAVGHAKKRTIKPFIFKQTITFSS